MSEVKKDADFQKFLDQNQYARKGILLYERIFGDTYISTGGERTTEHFCKQLEGQALKVSRNDQNRTKWDFFQLLCHQKGDKVLDVGCGIGGSAFYMARNYGVDVYGFDLSQNMINIAQDLRDVEPSLVKHRCNFYVEDATLMDYPEQFYDMVYSRDTILHIEDKLSLFKMFYKSLKPGGMVVITDYCRGAQDHR